VTTGETSLGGSRRDFPSTSWTLIRSAGDAGREGLERLIRTYWKPAYYYIRAAGRRSVEDAKDLTQDFFGRLVERRDWERLSPERGSFRGFLKRALKNFMTDAARREKARRPPSGALLFRFEEVRDAAEPSGTPSDPDTLFEEEWTAAVLEESIRELERRLRAEEASNLFDVFRLYCFPEEKRSGTRRFVRGQSSGGKTYADVAARLGIREADVRKRLARCRAELKTIVLEKIREYAGDEDEVREEYVRIVGA
jgi:RNA polymerase sigma-70 factor (ECF subfamily)